MNEYAQALTSHTERVREAHRVLDQRYAALSEVYDGVGAREFKTGWQRSRAAFEAYAEGAPPLLRLLEEKVAQLEAFDQGR
ncbi:MAG: hypothetical protein QM621_00220 [Aeromicrobium sp.]|uniref:hypothetical protein n=1 Tax=Aeromicrobium sp. TaxID=1871063 RepID=UPI0039E634E3